MAEDAAFRERIAPVPAGASRPLWSVMIPTFNCADYLRQSLASVLDQDPGPEVMQIEVVDDGSTLDDPEAVTAELGGGRVGFFRRPQNGGHRANFKTCLERSRGRLIHLLHGDDLVRDGFYRRLQAGFEAEPGVGAAFCRHVFRDEVHRTEQPSELERPTPGVLEGWLERIAVRQLIQTPSIAVRREVYETLGIFDGRLTWVEDWEMWVRIAAAYPVWYEPQPLAVYRMHGGSSSSRHMRTGENLRDIRRAVEMIQAYLPNAAAAGARRRSLRFWAEDTFRNRIPGLLASGELQTALVQAQEALRCSHSPAVLALAARLSPRFAKTVLKSLLSGR
jgi:GT2 family glycosyltransferase